MPLDLHTHAVLYVVLVGSGLLLISTMAGILAFYLGLIPILILGIGIGLPLYGLIRLLQWVSGKPRDARRPVAIVVGLTQCAVALYLGGVLIAHQVPSAFSPHAHAAADPLVRCPSSNCVWGVVVLSGVPPQA
jgi:hypothetical protein